jgi:Protein of unknown function (DUF1549)
MMKYDRWLPLCVAVLALALTPALRGGDEQVLALAARIDQRIAAAWDKDIKPAPVADDAEFFRRVHLDLAGRIPSVTEARDFLEDDQPDKRRLWVRTAMRAYAWVWPSPYAASAPRLLQQCPSSSGHCGMTTNMCASTLYALWAVSLRTMNRWGRRSLPRFRIKARWSASESSRASGKSLPVPRLRWLPREMPCETMITACARPPSLS